MKVVSFTFLFLSLLFAGCANTNTRVLEKGRSLEGAQRFFVLTNLKDNHRVGETIARALKARGREAEIGPETLQPENAQAVILYEDQWGWDFSTHMIYLKLSVRDPKAVFPYLAVEYRKHVEFTTDLDAVVGELVDELLAVKTKK